MEDQDATQLAFWQYCWTWGQELPQQWKTSSFYVWSRDPTKCAAKTALVARVVDLREVTLVPQGQGVGPVCLVYHIKLIEWIHFSVFNAYLKWGGEAKFQWTFYWLSRFAYVEAGLVHTGDFQLLFCAQLKKPSGCRSSSVLRIQSTADERKQVAWIPWDDVVLS